MAKVVYSEAALLDFERIIAIEILDVHPMIGRRIDGERRELIISAGATGYVAVYRYDPAFELIRILRIRHQREAGYRA
jgi:plasmid stabilization system protein ParE